MMTTHLSRSALHRSFVLVALVGLGGCASWDLPFFDAATPAVERPSEAVPTASANTAEALDTTTQEQRTAAQARPAGGAVLGVTVMSLGDPAEPGFWLKTPLVTAEGPGQIVDPSTGNTVAVTLMPIPGPATAGSRVSLATLRLLGLPLTALAEVEVRRAG
jgi:hypothetical protein